MRSHLKRGRFTDQRQSKKAGLPPGSVVHIGSKVVDKTTISVIDYSEKEFQQKNINNVQELAASFRKSRNHLDKSSRTSADRNY